MKVYGKVLIIYRDSNPVAVTPCPKLAERLLKTLPIRHYNENIKPKISFEDYIKAYKWTYKIVPYINI